MTGAALPEDAFKPGHGLGRPRGSATREDRLDLVLEVATRLFAERGFRATRLGDIAEELGVTRAALYYYFSGKTEVLEEVCGRSMDAVETALHQIRVVDDPAERLRRFTRQYAENVTASPARIFFREHAELRPAFRRDLVRRAQAVTSGAEDIVRYGIERGVFSPDLDVHVVTSALLAMLNSLADWFRPERDGTLVDVTDRLVEVFIRGMAPRD